jgi:hypothetical protein
MTPLLLLAALLAGAAPVHTDATSQAKAHFRAATDAYRRADYQTAIAEFEAAYAAKPAPVLRYNLAQCYERSGDIDSALKSYHQYLHESPDAEDRATVQVAIGNLERRLQERGVQQLLVYSEPPAAVVTIDGANRGTTPTSMELAPGLHRVRVALSGYAVTERQVSISADKSLELDFALQPQSAPPPPTADLTPREVAPAPRTAPAAQTTQPEAKPSHPRVLTWVAAGVAGLAGAGAVGLGLSASSSATKLTDGTIRDGAAAQGLHDSAQNKARGANILYGVAGLAGVAAVTLFVVEGSF